MRYIWETVFVYCESTPSGVDEVNYFITFDAESRSESYNATQIRTGTLMTSICQMSLEKYGVYNETLFAYK